MMYKSRRNEIQKTERNALIWFLIALGAVITVFGVSILFRDPALDTQSGCPKESSLRPDRVTTFLIDLTDPVSGFRASNALVLASDIVQSLEKHELFSVFILNSDNTVNLTPVFSKCNPGKPGISAYFSEGRRKISGSESVFVNEVKQAIKKEMSVKVSSERSPIIEAIRDITQSQYWGNNNRLYLLSDLLENSSVTSLYKPSNSFASVMNTLQGASIINSIDLTQTEVGICMIEYPAGRFAPAVRINLIQFWKSFFGHTGTSCNEHSCQFNRFQCNKKI